MDEEGERGRVGSGNKEAIAGWRRSGNGSDSGMGGGRGGVAGYGRMSVGGGGKMTWNGWM